MNDYHSDDDHGAMFAISQTQPEDPETPLGKMKQPPPTPGFQTRSLHICHGRTNDEIHTTIEFCPVVKAIMDTRPYQRLRGLKQLGTSEHTYVNASHSRFEHSLGVAHLAERQVMTFRKKQPNLPINKKDSLCSTLAGLCHDVGHGPFSHVYDDVFPERLQQHLERNPELRKEYADTKGPGNRSTPKWNHEKSSLMMIDSILAELGLAIDMENLDEPLEQIGDGVCRMAMRVYEDYESDDVDHDHKAVDLAKLVLTSRDWVFIKEMIIHEPIDLHDPNKPMIGKDESGFVGRPWRNQEFLYDTVANRHSGLDVDKIDYFARDYRRAFRGSGEIEVRLMDEAFVTWGTCARPDQCWRCRTRCRPMMHMQVCFPEKCAESVVAFFHHRFKLHSSVYTHKTTQATTYMVADILALADPYFRLSPSKVLTATNGGKSSSSDDAEEDMMPLPVSQAMLNPKVYERLKDSVIDLIEHSKDPRLAPAQAIIRRLQNRELYKCVSVHKINPDNKVDKKMWKLEASEVENQLYFIHGKHDMTVLTLEDIIVEKLFIHSGAKEENPLSRIRFLSKRELNFLKREDLSKLPPAFEKPETDFHAHMPRANHEYSFRVFCRSASKGKCQLLEGVFQRWIADCQDQFGNDGIHTFIDDPPDDDDDDYGAQPVSQDPGAAVTPTPGDLKAEEEESVRPSKKARTNLSTSSRYDN